ncbi:MAG: hypothetical protein FWG16_02675, partial [Micrococcales bacterium]|nr:hypothetical protein [Micrococcales bacterium]
AGAGVASVGVSSFTASVWGDATGVISAAEVDAAEASPPVPAVGVVSADGTEDFATYDLLIVPRCRPMRGAPNLIHSPDQR